jgi:hypothetical protein
MNIEGPILDQLTHRLSECPGEFLREPRIGKKGEIYVDAVVHDLVRALGGEAPIPSLLKTFSPSETDQRAYLRLVLVSSWLLADEWFAQQRSLARPALSWLKTGLHKLSGAVAADLFVTDPDRREELARVCLAALGLRPAGESEAQAEDRLRSLDSVERARLVRETQEREDRARKLREALKKKEATEAAAKASREW